MSLYRHPDAAIAAWLDDGPLHLSGEVRNAVKATIRDTRQRSVVVLPLPMLRRAAPWRLVLVAALALSLLAGLAFVAGMVPNVTQEPNATAGPTPAATHATASNPPAEGAARPTIRGAGRTIELEWPFAEGVVYDHGPVDPTFGGAGQQGYFFTFDGRGQYGAEGGHGFVIADVLGATVPYNDGVVLGDIDATTFMSRMGSSARFEVGAVAAASVGGLAGVEADVDGPTLERVASMDLSLPSHVIALDASGGIIAIQIWASSRGRLAEWLPEARSLLEELRFVEPAILECWPSPRAIQIDRDELSGQVVLDGTRIAIQYMLPPGTDVVAAAAPGVVGFEEPALEGLTGLSYGYGVGLANAPRGLVIGEATNAKAHGMAGKMFGPGADGFLDGLAAIPRVRLENVRDGRGPGGLVSRNAILRYDPGPSSWSHVDRMAGAEIGCVLDFTRPSRVSIVEVERTRLVFQAWAAGDAELARWLPIAQTFIESMQIEVAR